MATAIRETVVAALKAALDIALAGVTVERDRSIEVDTYPSVIVFDGGHTVSTENHGVDDIDLQVSVEIYVEGATDADIGPAYNDLQARVVVAMLADRKIAGIQDIEEQASDDPPIGRGEGQKPTKSGVTDFLVKYQRLPGDPYTLAP